MKEKEFCFTIGLTYRAATQELKLYKIFNYKVIKGKANFTSPMKEPQMEAADTSINQSRKNIWMNKTSSNSDDDQEQVRNFQPRTKIAKDLFIKNSPSKKIKIE